MNTIWKFPLDLIHYQQVSMPEGARILSVQTQSERITLWALVDDTTPNTDWRTIEIVGTGHQLSEAPRSYIGTVQTHDGAFVWHLFTNP